MEKLYILSTKDSPEVLLDPKKDIYSISGVCHPENVTKFYQPVIEWLGSYRDELVKTGSAKSIRFEFFFRYINSASYKYLITLLQKIFELNEVNDNTSVVWYYEPDDTDMRDAGNELFEYSGVKLSYLCTEKPTNAS